eukprot:scaffold54107_cov30-Tisochrysis_lutea.AAC.4
MPAPQIAAVGVGLLGRATGKGASCSAIVSSSNLCLAAASLLRHLERQLKGAAPQSWGRQLSAMRRVWCIPGQLRARLAYTR